MGIYLRIYSDDDFHFQRSGAGAAAAVNVKVETQMETGSTISACFISLLFGGTDDDWSRVNLTTIADNRGVLHSTRKKVVRGGITEVEEIHF